MKKGLVDDIYKIAEKYGFEVTRLEQYNIDGNINVRFDNPKITKTEDTDKMCEVSGG